MKLEELSASLRTLYAQYGYRPYKMSKFEEYELYSGNREFLLSDNIITFTDTDGKLMALKPDVTLSIIKNTDVDVRAGATEKLFYSENVYRVPKGAEGFREIMQTGLECIGGVDGYCVAEVLLLAAESLRAAGRRFVLDVGLPGLLAEVAARVTPDPEVQGQLLKCAAEKSLHGIDAVAAGIAAGASGSASGAVNAAALEALKTLSGLYGTPEETLGEAERVAAGLGLAGELAELKNVLAALAETPAKDDIRIDFSVAGGRNYYSGIAFKGYVEGVPERVLSGGGYDRLVARFIPGAKAIGFAVYLDTLERLMTPDTVQDGDVLLVYENGSPAEVLRKVQQLAAAGLKVKAVRAAEAAKYLTRYGRILNMGTYPALNTGTDPASGFLNTGTDPASGFGAADTGRAGEGGGGK